MVQPKNVTILKIPAKNQCLKTEMPFEEPDGMTDIDLHEIISCQSTPDTKGPKPRKHCMSKLLVTIGTGFIITTCLCVTLSQIIDSTTWSNSIPEYTERNSNTRKALETLKETAVKNENVNKNNMNSLESGKCKDIIKTQNKIKRDVSAFYNKDNTNQESKKSEILNSGLNKNAIQNDLQKWSDRSEVSNWDESTLNNADLTAVESTDLNNKFEQVPSTNYFDYGKNEDQLDSTDIDDSDVEESYERIPSTKSIYSQESRGNFNPGFNDWEYEGGFSQKEPNNDKLSSTTISDESSPPFANTENSIQSNVEKAWGYNTEEPAITEFVLSSTSMYQEESTHDRISTTDSLENKGQNEQNYHNIAEFESDIPLSTTTSYKTAPFFDFNENGDKSNAERPWDDNTEEAEVPQFALTSTSMYPEETTHDGISTTDSWEKNSDDNNIAQSGSDVLLKSAAAYGTNPFYSGNENGDQSHAERPWGDNTEETEVPQFVLPTTSIYSEETAHHIRSPNEGVDNSNFFGQTKRNDHNIGQFGNDSSSSTVAGLHETTSFFPSSENMDEPWEDHTEQREVSEYVLTSTTIYPEHSTYDVISTSNSWGNKQDQNIAQLGSDVLLSSATAYKTNPFFTDNENADQSSAESPWDGNTKEIEVTQFVLPSTDDPEHSKHHITSTAASWDNNNFFRQNGRNDDENTDESWDDHTEETEESTFVYPEVSTTHITFADDSLEKRLKEESEDKVAEYGSDLRLSSTTASEGTTTPFTYEKNDNQFYTEREEEDNMEKIEIPEFMPPSTSVYPEESTTHITSTTNTETSPLFVNNANGYQSSAERGDDNAKGPEARDGMALVHNWEQNHSFMQEERRNYNIPEFGSDFPVTASYGANPLFRGTENDDKSIREREKTVNMEETEFPYYVSPSLSIYQENTANDIISTTNSGKTKQSIEEYDQSDYSIAEFGSDAPSSSTTDSYEPTSVFAASERGDQSNMGRPWDGNTQDRDAPEYVHPFKSIDPEESTPRVRSTTGNWENKNEWNNDDIAEFGKDAPSSSTTDSYEATSVFADSESGDQSNMGGTWDGNTQDRDAPEYVHPFKSIDPEESTNGNWENKNQWNKEDMAEFGKDAPSTLTTDSFEPTFADSESGNQSNMGGTWNGNTQEREAPDYLHPVKSIYTEESTSTTGNWETTSALINSETSNQLNAEKTKDEKRKSIHMPEYVLVLPSTSIYPVEFSHDVTSTTEKNWENKQVIGQNEESDDNIAEFGNGEPLFPETPFYETTSVLTNSKNEESVVEKTQNYNTEEIEVEHILLSTSTYPQEVTRDFLSASWETQNRFSQNQPRYNSLEGFGNDNIISTPSYGPPSVKSENNDKSVAEKGWESNIHETPKEVLKIEKLEEDNLNSVESGESPTFMQSVENTSHIETRTTDNNEYQHQDINGATNFFIELTPTNFNVHTATVSSEVQENIETSSIAAENFEPYGLERTTDEDLIGRSMNFNIARFNRKVSDLYNNSSHLFQKNNNDSGSNLNRPSEVSSITNSSHPNLSNLPTTENNSSNNFPMNSRWAGQDASNFENIKIAAKEFGTINEQLQSNQQSTVNQNFGKTICPTFVSPMGFPVLQQPNAFPYLYNSNQASPYSNVMSLPIPRTQSNSYLPQQYPSLGVPSYSKAMMQQSGYVLYNVNGQNVIAPSPGGQYYICNPVSNVLGNTNTDEIAQVEIRKSMDDSTLQSFATEALENRTRASRNCPMGERSCEDDSKCIKTEHFCDGDVQCKDASDEAFCPCKYRIGKIRECDGYFDCPNGEDESKCFGCEANMFSCDDWSRNDRVATCIPAEQRCDGIPQCPTEKDEHDCSIITEKFSEKQHFIVSTTVGFLYRNYKGRWYPVCRNPELWANEACQLVAGPSTMAPLTHLIPVDINYNGPYISTSSEEDSMVVNSCEPGAAIFVECPPLVCGMRKKVRNPFRREEVDTSAEQILSQFQITNESSESKNMTDSILGDGRVVGGKPSQPEAWPWIVSVYRNGVFHCGGALINELWIVTAGHCVEKYWHYYYEVQAGVLRRYSYSPMIQNRMISQVIGHKLYDRTKLKNDLALMKMSKPLQFGRYVRPICLPSEITAGKHFKWGPEPGTVCTAVGWGATVEHGSDPDHLREVEVPILNHCKHREDQEGNEICAGLMEGGKDACQGDSGGPFMCRNPNSPNQWYLAGIVSHGEGCARPNEPGVYTRVSLFLDWIFENIRADTVPQTKPLLRCPGYICRKTNRCIANKRRCNKVVDCLLGDDEMHCENKDFNEIFKHAMRHMFLGLQQENNQTTTEPNQNDTLGSLLAETNPSIADNLENSSDITEISIRVQEFTTLPNNQSYNKRFVCKRILQTISVSKQCDRTADCEDATDEQNCSCADYLRNSHPQAICNGLTDCIDMSDELNCHTCKQNEYHCRKSNICIIMEKKCNHIPDCPFEEDEWDCFALTNGKTITLDGDLRPYLNDSGLISFNHNGTWRPLCSNWSGMEASMAADTCFYLGFSDYRSFLKVPIYDIPLEVIHKSIIPTTNILPTGTRCTGLFVKCSDVIDVTHLTEHANISKIINNMQGNPWNAEIYVNGKFKCTGTILDVDWIITSTSCFAKDFKLVNTYVAVLLGRTRTLLNVMGPHEQILRINESIQVSDSEIILLRLNKKIHISRYVRPIRFSVRDYTVTERETCIALGRNFDNFTESVILQAVTNCTFGYRCFKRTQPIKEFCQNKNFIPWTGNIVCQSKHGWYPAAVFYESKGSCGFTTTAAYTSVQYWRANIIRLMKQAVFAVDAPQCNGFRCNLGRCLEEHDVCDEIPNCHDAGDEDPNYCSEKRKQCSVSSSCVCLKSELKCQNGKCVPKTAFCDTNNDCGDWSDEPESCNCRSYLSLSHPDLICDGIRNCQDRTDEDPYLCTCKRYHFACGDNHCIPQDMVCDGIPDCPNGLDEARCMALTSTPESAITEVQVRTAGIWHPGCFPKNITTLELERICEKIGFTGGSAIRINATNNWKTTWRPVTDPFTGIRIHHGVKKNIIIAIRSGKNPFVTLKPDFNCYRLYLQCS